MKLECDDNFPEFDKSRYNNNFSECDDNFPVFEAQSHPVRAEISLRSNNKMPAATL